jgi:hypothetical protein
MWEQMCAKEEAKNKEENEEDDSDEKFEIEILNKYTGKREYSDSFLAFGLNWYLLFSFYTWFCSRRILNLGEPNRDTVGFFLDCKVFLCCWCKVSLCCW